MEGMGDGEVVGLGVQNFVFLGDHSGIVWAILFFFIIICLLGVWCLTVVWSVRTEGCADHPQK